MEKSEWIHDFRSLNRWLSSFLNSSYSTLSVSIVLNFLFVAFTNILQHFIPFYSRREICPLLNHFLEKINFKNSNSWLLHPSDSCDDHRFLLFSKCVLHPQTPSARLSYSPRTFLSLSKTLKRADDWNILSWSSYSFMPWIYSHFFLLFLNRKKKSGFPSTRVVVNGSIAEEFLSKKTTTYIDGKEKEISVEKVIETPL